MVVGSKSVLGQVNIVMHDQSLPICLAERLVTEITSTVVYKLAPEWQYISK